MYNKNIRSLLRSAILYAGNQTKRKKRTAGSDYYGLISKGERGEKIEKEKGTSVRAEKESWKIPPPMATQLGNVVRKPCNGPIHFMGKRYRRLASYVFAKVVQCSPMCFHADIVAFGSTICSGKSLQVSIGVRSAEKYGL